MKSRYGLMVALDVAPWMDCFKKMDHFYGRAGRTRPNLIHTHGYVLTHNIQERV